MKTLTLAAVALVALASAQDRKPKSWDQFGGGPEHRNAFDAKLPPNLVLSWKKTMGCAVPGRAQFVAGGGLLFGSSP